MVKSDFDKKVEIKKEEKFVDLKKELEDHFEIDARTFSDTKEMAKKL